MKSTPSDVAAFFIELYTRMALKSPRFFQILQTISIIAAAVAGLPAIIAQFQGDLGIVLPGWLLAVSSKTVAISAIVAWWLAKLPVSNVSTVVNNSSALPFTEKKITEGVDPTRETTLQQLKK